MLDSPSVYPRLLATEPWKSEHFVIRSLPRNPREGPGAREHGVDPALLRVYADALEEAYALLTSPPWNYPPPKVPTEVLVYDVRDVYGFVEPDGRPDKGVRMHLTAHPRTSSKRGDLACARATAIHEVVHVMQHQWRDLTVLKREGWRWFAEAHAVFHEARACGPRGDWLAYGLDWTLHSHVSPLRGSHTWYWHAAMVDQLQSRYGPELIRNVWGTRPSSGESAVATLSRVLKGAFANPKREDFFGSHYCVDAWFGPQHGKDTSLWALADRYGQRALACSWNLTVGTPVVAAGTVEALACCYHRIHLPPMTTGVRRPVTVQIQGDTARLKTTVCSVNWHGRECGPRRQLPAGETMQDVRIDSTAPGADHFLIVVSHCGDAQGGISQAQYELTIRFE